MYPCTWHVCVYIRNSRFGCGTEEDSHEALRYILSALREEEIKVHYQLINNCSVYGDE